MQQSCMQKEMPFGEFAEWIYYTRLGLSLKILIAEVNAPYIVGIVEL